MHHGPVRISVLVGPSFQGPNNQAEACGKGASYAEVQQDLAENVCIL